MALHQTVSQTGFWFMNQEGPSDYLVLLFLLFWTKTCRDAAVSHYTVDAPSC